MADLGDGGPSLPREPIHRLVAPLERFLHVEAASGVVLLLASGVALALANSPAGEAYAAFWKTPAGFSLGGFSMQHSLHHWINDGLMGIFFFVIGLEVKRELVTGELRDPRRAALPLAAAVGGMLVPAGLYLLLQRGGPAASGWGVPMATDIAFVVGCLAVLGDRVPPALRAMLLSLAIADDIGAILVIAVGYSSGIAWLPLGLAIAGVGLVLLLARIGVRSVPIYVGVGAAVWFAFHESGIHATLAGVILGLVTPTRRWVGVGLLGELVDRSRRLLEGEGVESARSKAALRYVEAAAREALSPLERLETALHPWSSFAIMPLFALANAGVAFSLRDLVDPVALAVAIGLFVGKPLGIVAASWLAVRAGLAQLPARVTWRMLLGAGFLAGIGFTMALFIAGLAFDPTLLGPAKVGVLAGSLASGVLGLVWLRASLPAREHWQ